MGAIGPLELALGGVPQAHCPIGAAGRQHTAGGVEAERAYSVAVAVERDQTTGNPAKVRLVKRRRGSAALAVYDGCYVDPQSGQMFSCEIPTWKYEWDRNKRQGA